MSTTEPPTSEIPPRRSWRSRLRSRGAVITAAVAALVVIGGVTAALLLPDHDRGRFGPGVDRAGWSGPPWAEGRHGGPMGGHWGDDDDRFEGQGGPRGFGSGNEPVVTGTVASVANGSIVVTVDGAGQRTIRTDGDTRVRGSGNSGLGDLQVGERVVVEVAGTGDAATAESIWVPQASVAGTVTALGGDTAIVTSVEGLTVTVNTAALSQKPAVGDVVVLTGTADGGTIRADGIRVLPKAS
ncbi:hypothetical protein [Pseudonocardia adelaidensis]